MHPITNYVAYLSVCCHHHQHRRAATTINTTTTRPPTSAIESLVQHHCRAILGPILPVSNKRLHIIGGDILKYSLFLAHKRARGERALTPEQGRDDEQHARRGLRPTSVRDTPRGESAIAIQRNVFSAAPALRR